MPFTNTPTADTYSSHRVQLAPDIRFVEGNHTFSTLYSGMTNIMPYKDEDTGTEFGETRSGALTVTVTTGTNLTCRGFYLWEKSVGTAYYYVVVGDGTNTLVYTSTDSVTWTNVNSWADTARTPVRFTEFINATNTKSLVLVTGTRGYVFTTNAAGTQITDADFPNPHIPFPIFLNSRLYLAKAQTGDIYNSDLNDPTSWTAGNFISSEVYPDDVQALVKINNYILAIGLQGCEFFYDNANALGSPLSRYDSGVMPFGTQFPNSIAANKDSVTLLGNRTDGGEFIFLRVEGFNFKQIPANDVIKYVNSQLAQSLTTPASIMGSYFRENGEEFYFLNMNGASLTLVPTHTTMVYSFSQKKWVRTTANSTEPMPVVSIVQGGTGFPFPIVAGRFRNDIIWGVLSSEAAEDIYSGTHYPVYQEVITPPNDFGTMNRKFMSRAGLLYNRYTDSGAINVQFSDDGMSTFSTARQLAGVNQTGDGGFPFITQLGSFRRRGFKVYSSGGKARYDALEVDINKGQQ